MDKKKGKKNNLKLNKSLETKEEILKRDAEITREVVKWGHSTLGGGGCCLQAL